MAVLMKDCFYPSAVGQKTQRRLMGHLGDCGGRPTWAKRKNDAGGTLSAGATSGTVGPTRYKVRGQWRVQGTFKKFKILGIPLFKKRLK